MKSEIEAITGKGEYEHYGLRVVSNLCDQFRAEWLEKQGLPTAPISLEVGQIAPCSYRWDDGNLTDDELDGTSAVEIKDAAKALKAIEQYSGRQIALLGSYYVSYGDDDAEIVMQDAVVLAVWER